ncbi:MAG: pyridoxal-phosphate dependent enzyme [Gemmatimonadetes bacterium]|nr:pyridoxal-phosphate dependent enzyme [Gemmatimonadota bacterium]
MSKADVKAVIFRDARERIAGRIHVTPVLSASRIGDQAGIELFLKCENLQKTGSFKVRGVLNRLLQMDPQARRRGVVTVSAGNHAQALAWGARATGAPCVVVMPESASRGKVEASAGYGAEVILYGTARDAFARARELARERNLTFIHPFDDEEIIAGHGTLGLEIVEQLADANVLVVPVGGGGLIAGVAAAVKALVPNVRVYGVEPEGAAAMRRSLDADHPVHLDRVDTIADGLGAPMAGELTFAFVRRHVDDVVLVSDAQIAEAVRLILSSTKLLAEPAGAAGVAALLAHKLPVGRGARVVAVLSGGNLDMERLKEIL